MVPPGIPYRTRGMTSTHDFPGGALVFPVTLEGTTNNAGINIHIPVSMRTKSPFAIRTLWAKYELIPVPLQPSQTGTARFTLEVFGRMIATGLITLLGTYEINVVFTETGYVREDVYVDTDITACISTDLDHITLLFSRWLPEEGDTLNLPCAFIHGRSL